MFTQEEMQEFKQLCAPLVDFPYKHGSPHHKVIITQTDAELVGGEMAVVYEPRD